VPAWTPQGPEVMSARRLAARAAALHEEVAKKESFSSQADRQAARARLDADADELQQNTTQKTLRAARMALASRDTLGWKDWNEESTTRSRRTMLEAHRACQRHEDAVQRSALAARALREAGLRQVELSEARREEAARLHGQRMQEETELRRQRQLAARRQQSERSNADDREALRQQLAEAQVAQERERDDVKQRVADDRKRSLALVARARILRERRMREEREELQEERRARSDMRGMDAAIERARKKETVMVEAAAVLHNYQMVVERVQVQTRCTLRTSARPF
jgi:hypothetical protein